MNLIGVLALQLPLLVAITSSPGTAKDAVTDPAPRSSVEGRVTAAHPAGSGGVGGGGEGAVGTALSVRLLRLRRMRPR